MGKLSIETHNNIDKNWDRVYKDKMINRTPGHKHSNDRTGEESNNNNKTHNRQDSIEKRN